MKKVLKHNNEAGSQEQNEPRLLGSIVEEMLHGNSPLAKGYRQYIASQENGATDEPEWHRNTDLCCILKTMLRSDRKMKSGKDYMGVLRRDAKSEDYRYDVHYTFTETLPLKRKRNPQVFEGEFITITCRDDGSLRPNFKAVVLGGNDFNIDSFAFGVAYELRTALEGLVENEKRESEK